MNIEQRNELIEATTLVDEWGDEYTFNADNKFRITRVGALETAFSTLEEAVKAAEAKSSRNNRETVVVEIRRLVIPHRDVTVVNIDAAEFAGEQIGEQE